MSFQDAITTCLMQKYVDFSGRARRSEFWYFVLFNFLVSIVASMLAHLIHFGLLTSIVSLALFLPYLAVAIRRLHDTGRSGWWVLLGLIPLVGIIILIVWWATDGQPAPNQHGASPKYAGGPSYGYPAG